MRPCDTKGTEGTQYAATWWPVIKIASIAAIFLERRWIKKIIAEGTLACELLKSVVDYASQHHVAMVSWMRKMSPTCCHKRRHGRLGFFHMSEHDRTGANWMMSSTNGSSIDFTLPSNKPNIGSAASEDMQMDRAPATFHGQYIRNSQSCSPVIGMSKLMAEGSPEAGLLGPMPRSNFISGTFGLIPAIWGSCFLSAETDLGSITGLYPNGIVEAARLVH